jgi:ribosomal protein L24E
MLDKPAARIRLREYAFSFAEESRWLMTFVPGTGAAARDSLASVWQIENKKCESGFFQAFKPSELWWVALKPKDDGKKKGSAIQVVPSAAFQVD